MGRVKNYSLDIEHSESILVDIINMLQSDINIGKGIKLSKYVKFIYILLADLDNNKSKINIHFYKFIIEHIEPIHDKIEELFRKKTSDNKKSTSLLDEFDFAIFMYKKTKFRWANNEMTKKAINSEGYYNKRIKELESIENDLRNTLKETTDSTKEETKRVNKDLEIAKIKIAEYKKTLEIKKKQEDAKEDWENNIVNAFDELKTYLKPIKSEQNRLNALFWVYLIFSVLLVIGVAVIEYVVVEKLSLTNGFPDFKQYITIYMPLPVAGALLWGFIYQMNRAQRQLVVMAKSIHNVEYVQGLLLSINKLAPNQENAINRINIALDKLIDNHLNIKGVETEEELIKEEDKDVVPVDAIIKIMKELKGVVGK